MSWTAKHDGVCPGCKGPITAEVFTLTYGRRP